VEERTKGSRVAIVLGIPSVVIGAVLVAWTLLHRVNAGTVSIGALPGTPHAIARLLFHDFLLPFEVTSVLILIAILGAVVLASRPEAIARHHQSAETPKAAPELVGAGKEH
jgi:NADH-quinone oxidoreductase subunit J